MAKRYIISLTASNRVGILAALTTALDELNASLVELSQTVLQDFFTIILAADFPENNGPELILDHIEGICRPFSVKVNLSDPMTVNLPMVPAEDYEIYFLTVKGPDQPGITRDIFSKLASESIDIHDLYGRSESDDDVFSMIMELAVPTGTDKRRIRADLEHLCEACGLLATMEHEDDFAAEEDAIPIRVAATQSSSQTAELGS